MKKLLFTLVSTSCASVAVTAYAQDVPPPLEPETVITKPAIDPGPNLFVLEGSWDGASSLQVYGAEDLVNKGAMTTGSMAQSQVSADGNTAYTISTYMERIVYGPAKMVLQAFDVDTLTVKGEVELPPKVAMVGPYEHLLQLTADENYALVMNATPAASVTIVDLAAMAVTMEVPTPGCWSIYPATAGLKWTMLCGDGTAITYVMNDAGTEIVSQNTAPLFDVDEDPLFVHAERGKGDELLFVSFGGDVYRVSDAGDAPELVEMFSITDPVDDPFAPGGYAIAAYNAANDFLFVVMHADPYDGSHKDAGTEVWVVDMANSALKYRLQPKPGIVSLWVDDEAMPTLYAFNEEEGIVFEYGIDPAATFGIILSEIAEVDVDGGQVLTVRQ